MDLLKFDLRRLRLLRELHLRGTIAAVAEALNYSSASVSQQLTILQREMGITLLEPEGRTLRLTPQARLLVEHIDKVFAQLERADVDLTRAHSEVAGTVKLAAFQSAALTVVPRALIALRQKHPLLRIEVNEAESELARSGLLPRDFDLVLDEVFPGQELAHSAKLSQDELFEEPMCIVDAPGSVPGIRLEDYANRPWVMEPENSPARGWVMSVCRAAGFDPDVQFESTDLIVHERLAASGLAVAMLPNLLPQFPEGSQRHQLDPRHVRRIVATTRAVAHDHPAIVAVREALSDAVSGPQ